MVDFFYFKSVLDHLAWIISIAASLQLNDRTIWTTIINHQLKFCEIIFVCAPIPQLGSRAQPQRVETSERSLERWFRHLAQILPQGGVSDMPVQEETQVTPWDPPAEILEWFGEECMGPLLRLLPHNIRT